MAAQSSTELCAFLFMGYQDIFLSSTDSTNRIAREMGANGAAHGSGVVADTQTAGRGRLGREWFSPPGKNLYCSYVVRPDINLEDYPKLTLAAGVAVVDCLGQTTYVEAGLKWPNDIYIDNRKCGGILCESSSITENTFAIIGIGINCNLSDADIPEDLKGIATSLSIESGTRVNVRKLFHDIRDSLLDVILILEKRGFSEILTSWNSYDSFRSTRMTWVRADGKPVEGVSLGPDPDGSLVVEDSDGNRHKVISGDVTLVES